MRPHYLRTARPLALALALVACSAERLVAPVSPDTDAAQFAGSPRAAMVDPLSPQGVRISEVHYDNPSTDVGEAIEISAPAGTDLTGWSIVRYNGSTPSAAVVYSSPGNPVLSGTVPAAGGCGTRGVVVVTYPQDGLQNGPNDGFALVNAAGEVVELLSYEGPFTASNGPAAGKTSTDVGLSQTGATIDATTSIQRVYNAQSASFSWQKLARTFGQCNDDNSGATPPTVATVTVTPGAVTLEVAGTQQLSAVALDANGSPVAGATFAWSSSASGVATVSSAGLVTAVSAGDAIITVTSGGRSATASVHVNPVPTPMPDVRFSELHYDNTSTDVGERIEVEGPAGTSLAGWRIVLYDGNGGAAYFTANLSGTLASTCNSRGVVTVDFAQIQNGSPDGMALVDASGQVIEFLSYEGVLTAADGPAAGRASVDIGASENGSGPTIGSLQRTAANSWTVQASNNFGSVNACGGPVLPPPPSKSIVFSGRDPINDAPLPVGFEAQLFATEYIDGVATTNAITWDAVTPAIATIDSRGVFRGVSAGTATFRATAADGTTATRDMPIVLGEHSTVAYEGNTMFGEPADGDASDDFLVRRPEFTSSFNRTRGTPNWVSYRIDLAYHPSGIDRCNCFTWDPLLPGDMQALTTADYTGAGAYAGYGIDRGHLARSFDRTAGTLDNAATFYFSNIVPQAADLNQGPWASLENALGDSAYVAGRSVYVIAGVIGNKGTVKGEGKIVIPAATWKVAVILPAGRTLDQIRTPADLTVIAVVMPNEPGVRSVPWSTYITTVDDVEQRSGYDVLSLLEANVQRAVEANDTPPVARIAASSTAIEGSSVAFDASASSDADPGDVLTFSWQFGDGSTATTASASHAYADNGTYTVTLTVTDRVGVTATATHVVTVANAAPVATFTAPASGQEGTAFSLALTGVSDAGSADVPSLQFAFDCGLGLGAFSASATVSCTPANNGAWQVRAVVRDKDGGETSYDATVLVANVAPTARLLAPASVIEGSVITVSLTDVFDPGVTDRLSFAFDCGGGFVASATADGSCPARDDGVVTIRARVSDEDGGESVYSSTVSVLNAVPAVTSVTAPASPAARGSLVSLAVTFTDAGSADTHALTVSWGDGTTSTVLAGLASSALATHAYASAGFYTLSATLSDDDGGAAAPVRANVIVFDPAGSVRMNAWFQDPAFNFNGAKGKVQLQVEAAYQSGQPTGFLDLDHNGTGLRVRGVTFDYLVVQGAQATLRGRGAAADGQALEFLVLLRDGKLATDKVNRVRAKVWDRTTGAIILDTEPGVDDLAPPATVLGGGQINIGK